MRFLIAVLLLLVPIAAFAQGKVIYGMYERIVIPEIGKYEIKAKMDTGALTTSIGASDIKIFKKDGVDWVSFKPQLPDIEGVKTLERPLARLSRIKGSDTTAGESNVRPVVMLDICLDGRIKSVEVNLANRSNFNYSVLIGRKALVGFDAIIDPSVKYRAGGCDALLNDTP